MNDFSKGGGQLVNRGAQTITVGNGGKVAVTSAAARFLTNVKHPAPKEEPLVNKGKGFYIALDATGSRQATWNAAREIQSEAFKILQSAGVPIECRLVYKAPFEDVAKMTFQERGLGKRNIPLLHLPDFCREIEKTASYQKIQAEASEQDLYITLQVLDVRATNQMGQTLREIGGYAGSLLVTVSNSLITEPIQIYNHEESQKHVGECVLTFADVSPQPDPTPTATFSNTASAGVSPSPNGGAATNAQASPQPTPQQNSPPSRPPRRGFGERLKAAFHALMD